MTSAVLSPTQEGYVEDRYSGDLFWKKSKTFLVKLMQVIKHQDMNITLERIKNIIVAQSRSSTT